MNNPSQPIVTSSHICTWSRLLQQVHNDLRVQHPEWVEPNGESPICDSYEARLMEQLEVLTRTEADDTHSRIVLPSRGFGT
jgi:hypothetical protein